MQIKLIKPINTELNHFIMRNNLQPTPKKNNQNNQILIPFKENQPLINNLNRSPARSTSRKAINSKQQSLYSITSNDSYASHQAKNRKSTTSLSRKCQNHDQVIGQYHINIEGQDLFYCQKCAIKLKNQGFPIRKDLKSNVNSAKSLLPQKNIKCNIQQTYPNLKGHPQFQALKQLLGNIYSIQQNMKNVHKSSQWQQNFIKKQMQIESFYIELQNIIRLKKNQSKITLNHIKQNWIQNSEQREQHFNESLSDLNVMKNDIQNNIQSIVGEVEEQTFKQCVQNYQQRLESYERLIMDKHNDLNKLNGSLQNILQNAIVGFDNDLIKIKEDILSQKDQKINMSGDDENGGYSCKEDINGPFRKLFQNTSQNHKEERRDKSRQRLISKK